MGFVSGLNEGFAAAKGEYLTWSSDDDLMAPEAITTMANVLDAEADIDFVYTHYSMIDMDGKLLGPGHVEDPDGLDKDNYVGHCFLYRRKVYEAIGDYRPEPFLVEDYEYWLRIREKFRMKRLPEALYCHRSHPSALTSIHGQDKMLAAVARVRRPFIAAWKHHFFVACWHYHAGRRAKSFAHAWASLLFRPWNISAWRIMVLSILPARLLSFIRSIKG
jgi:GT2 family glycosyltransferase